MFERIQHMLIKEFIQVFRDPRMRMVIFVIPCVQVMVIGYAVSNDVHHVPLVVLDYDNSQASREFVSRFTATEYFDLAGYVRDDKELQDRIDRGQAGAALCFQHGFAEDLDGGRTSEIHLIIDGTDSNTAAVVGRYAAGIAAEFSQQILLSRSQRAIGRAPLGGLPELRSRSWFNENLESRNYYVPAVIVVVVTLLTLLLTSMAVVREKEIGTMEQILVTPIRPLEFILGKTVPFFLIGLLAVLIVTLLGVFWFEVPFRGSVALLFGSTALYLLTTLGAGLFISTVSQTQQQAMISTFFFFFPAMLLSGFAFPIANMPEPVQWLTLVNPLAHFLVIVRGIFLKGVGVAVLWPQLLALFLMGVGILFLAAQRFHKTL